MDWTVLGQQVFYGLSNGMAYAMFAVGLVLIFGILGVINVAHGEFYMLGAMILAWLITSFGVNFFLAAFITIAVGALLGILANRLVVQPIHGRPGYVLATWLATLGGGLFITNVAMATWGTAPKITESPIPFLIHPGGVAISGERVALFVVGGVALWLFVWWMTKSRMGKMLRAVAQDAVSARLVGINLMRVYATGFALATAMAAVAGILLAPIWFASPYMGQSMLVKGFVVCIVAGMTNIRGAIIVALFLGLIEALFGQYVSMSYREAVGYGLMIIVLLVRPQGVFGRR